MLHSVFNTIFQYRKQTRQLRYVPRTLKRISQHRIQHCFIPPGNTGGPTFAEGEPALQQAPVQPQMDRQLRSRSHYETLGHRQCCSGQCTSSKQNRCALEMITNSPSGEGVWLNLFKNLGSLVSKLRRLHVGFFICMLVSLFRTMSLAMSQ